jgi:hypothetical protein
MIAALLTKENIDLLLDSYVGKVCSLGLVAAYAYLVVNMTTCDFPLATCRALHNDF